MSKFVLFFTIASLMTSSFAFAQTKDEEKQIFMLRQALIKVAYVQFENLREFRDKCVQQGVSDTALKTFLLGAVVTSLGTESALKQTVKKVLGSAADDSTKLRLLQNQINAGALTEHPAALRFRIMRKGWIAALSVIIADWGYYFATGNDLLSKENLHSMWRSVTGKNSDEANAQYFMTEQGFAEFLNYGPTHRYYVKRMFDLNPRLMVAVMAANKYTEGLSCNALAGFSAEDMFGELSEPSTAAPKTLEKPPTMAPAPAPAPSPKGETL